MNEIKIKLLDSGIASLINGYIDFFNVQLKAFIVGDAVNFVPDVHETMPRGNITFSGNTDLLKVKLLDNNKSIKVTCIIPEQYDNIDIGNIVLYSYYNNTNTPFCMLVLSEVITKRNPTSQITDQFYKQPGNRLVVNITISYIDIDNVTVDYEINVMNPTFANLPYFGDDFDIPLTHENPHSQFVVNEMFSLGKLPAFVTKSSDNQHYFASPIFQNIASPKFGILNSFNADFYNNERITWVWGQTYDTPDEGFKGVVGGISYEDTSNLTVIGGLSY